MIRIILVAGFMVGFFAGSAHSAVWHGHTVKATLVGQIDASPCPKPSCLKGIVGVFVDGRDVRDHVVRCAWPTPRVLDFSRRGYPHRHYAKVHVCGLNHWWRFR
jgi:hypothetical protein